MFKTLQIKLTDQDLDKLFVTIDKDGSGGIDQTEMMDFLHGKIPNAQIFLQRILIDIKSQNRLSLKDLKQLYNQMP